MQIVIDISEGIYKDVKAGKAWVAYDVCSAVQHGTPLPKGHGRLIDADAIHVNWEDFTTQGDYVKAQYVIDEAPTIIEAGKEEVEE